MTLLVTDGATFSQEIEPCPSCSLLSKKPLGASSDPERARRFHGEHLKGRGARTAHFCSMCGPSYCPMKLARDLFD